MLREDGQNVKYERSANVCFYPVWSHLICDWFIQMEDTVIDDIISLESSMNDEFLTLIDSGLQLASTVTHTHTHTHSNLRKLF